MKKQRKPQENQGFGDSGVEKAKKTNGKALICLLWHRKTKENHGKTEVLITVASKNTRKPKENQGFGHHGIKKPKKT